MRPGRACELCGFDFHPSRLQCPHCARPGLFPNVHVAQQPGEQAALERRYRQARTAAARRSATAVLDRFERAVGASVAVIGRPLVEVQRIVNSDDQLYTTYYKLTDAESRVPSSDEWDALRRVADEALFPGYREHLRFAALTLDGVGPASYGQCFLVLRGDMIAHRASAFEENTAL